MYGSIFTGSIPASIDSLQILEDRDLVENKFTGIIPDTLGNMIMLKSIHLYHLYYANLWDCNESHSASLNMLPKHSKLNNKCQSRNLDTNHEDSTVNNTSSAMVNNDDAFGIILRLIMTKK